MVKKSSSAWLRSLLRAGKQQQRSLGRALSGLLAAPAKKAVRKPRVAKKTLTAPTRKVAPVTRKVAAVTPAAPASGKWLASHYAGVGPKAGVRRLSYWLYVPDSAAADALMPLVVMLHGCDQTATLFAQGTRMNQLAEARGIAVLYPQQSVSSHPHRCWKWYDRATQQGGGDVPFIVGMIEQVAARYPIDRSRMYIAGISAGAGMAHIVALNHPELFAGVGLHSGPLFGAGHSTIGAIGVMQHGAGHRVDGAVAEVMARHPEFPPLPTLLIQGEDDEVVRPVNQAQLARQAMLLNRLPAESAVDVISKTGSRRTHPYELRDVYRGRKLMLRVARIGRLKHAWSGGDERLSFNAAAGPDASRMMLDFFGRHRRLPGAQQQGA